MCNEHLSNDSSAIMPNYRQTVITARRTAYCSSKKEETIIIAPPINSWAILTLYELCRLYTGWPKK